MIQTNFICLFIPKSRSTFFTLFISFELQKNAIDLVVSDFRLL